MTTLTQLLQFIEENRHNDLSIKSTEGDYTGKVLMVSNNSLTICTPTMISIKFAEIRKITACA